MASRGSLSSRHCYLSPPVAVGATSPVVDTSFRRRHRLELRPDLFDQDEDDELSNSRRGSAKASPLVKLASRLSGTSRHQQQQEETITQLRRKNMALKEAYASLLKQYIQLEQEHSQLLQQVAANDSANGGLEGMIREVSVTTLKPVANAPAFAEDENVSAEDSVEGKEEEPSIALDDEEKIDNLEKEKEIKDDKEETESQNQWLFPGVMDGDGSETDADGLPRRFLQMQKGNREKALAALQHTLQWREEHEVDTILQRPHTKFDICKAVLPHYFAGRDPSDHVVFVQRPGLTDLQQAAKNDLSHQELLNHYVYTLEYCWNIIEPSPDATMTSVIDLTGISFSTLKDSELMSFCKQFVGMMSSHYPSRSYKTLLINTPKWFGMLYKLISPMLRESTKAKIQICSKGAKQDDVLRQCLGHVPSELLSTASTRESSSDIEWLEMEENFRSFCVARTEEAGQEMQPVI